MCDQRDDTIPKKKRKKSYITQGQTENSVVRCEDNEKRKTETMNNGLDELPLSTDKTKSKKKRKKNKEDIGDSVVEIGESTDTCPGKKRKKQTKEEFLPEDDIADIKAKKKKKKHKKDKEEDSSDDTVTNKGREGEASIEEVMEGKKKKEKHKHEEGSENGDYRKKKGKLEAIKDESEHCDVILGNKDKKKRKKRHKCEEEGELVHTDVPVGSECVDKKKEKKKKQKISNVIDSEELSEPHIKENTEKRKKKKKKQKVDENRVDVDVKQSCEVKVNEDTAKRKKKKKRKTKKDSTDDGDVISPNDVLSRDKEEKLKTQSQSYNSLPFDYGESDAKQESYNCQPYDYGKEDQKPLASGCAGQWNTASFGDDQRQQKFLRLLGGFKKAGGSETIKCGRLFGKLERVGGNSAMNREEEERFNENLQRDYDKALSYKFSKQKTAGFGFEVPPGEGKKFYIDKTSSKSVKFDDSE